MSLNPGTGNGPGRRPKQRPIVTRLTEGEAALAARVFGTALDVGPVRVLATPFPRAFVPGRWFGRDWICWPTTSLVEDMSVAPLSIRATLVHELVHVWQAQVGVNLLAAKLRAGDGPAAYAYAPVPDCVWDGLNIEQQAMVVEHRYRLSQGGTVPADGAFYDRVCPF